MKLPGGGHMTSIYEQASAHITKQSPLTPVIEAWNIYLNDQDRSPYTIKAFIGDLQLLAKYLPPDKKVGDITTNDINNFLNWLQHKRGVPCSAKSLARRITSIKAFFRWLQKNVVTDFDPAEKIVQKSVISPLPTVLNPEEENLILETAYKYRQQENPDARPYTLLTLLLATGIKKGECLAIKLNHIDNTSASKPKLYVRYANQRYRYKERNIDLTTDWIESLNEYKEQYQPTDTLFPWSPRRLEYLLEEIGEKAGISKHLSFDMCRWTSALNDWRANIDHEKIRQKLGISKIQFREISNKLKTLSTKIDTGAI